MIPVVSGTVKGNGDGGVTFLDWSATVSVAALTEVASEGACAPVLERLVNNDHYFSTCMPRFEITDCFGSFSQWVLPIDDRGDLSGRR